LVHENDYFSIFSKYGLDPPKPPKTIAEL
jgi:hypothetical protein